MSLVVSQLYDIFDGCTSFELIWCFLVLSQRICRSKPVYFVVLTIATNIFNMFISHNVKLTALLPYIQDL